MEYDDPYNLETFAVKQNGLFRINDWGAPSYSYITVDPGASTINYDDYGKHGLIAIGVMERLFSGYTVILGEDGYLVYRRIPVQFKRPKLRLWKSFVMGFVDWAVGSKSQLSHPSFRYDEFLLPLSQARKFACILDKLSADRYQAMMMSLDLGLFPSGK